MDQRLSRDHAVQQLSARTGVDHGFIDAGPSPTGLMDALVSWLEDGKAPGSTDEAANFISRTPTR
jgi:hypothetical protein